MSHDDSTSQTRSGDVSPTSSAESANQLASGDSADESSATETQDEELASARAKAQTYLDLAQRTQADFVNYKRRVELDRSDYARSARADIILKFLPVIDDFERAVENLPASLASNDWAQGVALIQRKLHAALDQLGVKPLEAVGKPFDPYQEEAVLHEPSATYPPETVTRIVRSGYVLDGKVIRPAQVIVSSDPLD
jgi:molecular chaperone GrpE